MTVAARGTPAKMRAAKRDSAALAIKSRDGCLGDAFF